MTKTTANNWKATQAVAVALRETEDLLERLLEQVRAELTDPALQSGTLDWGHHGNAAELRRQIKEAYAFAAGESDSYDGAQDRNEEAAAAYNQS